MRLAHLTFALIFAATIVFRADSYAQTVPQPAPTETPITASARAKAATLTPQQNDPGTDPSSVAATGQEPNAPRTRLQLGVALKGTMTPGIDTNNALDPTFVWRWRGRFSRVDDRWAPAYRLSSFNSRVTSQLGARELPVGDMKIRPLMVGLDYKMPRGKWNWSAGMSVGWAMNSLEIPWQYRASATDAVGANDLWADVHNSFVWGPRLKGWYDVNRRLSYMVESAYLVTRPEIDVRANGRLSTRRLNADGFILKAGVVYGIF